MSEIIKFIITYIIYFLVCLAAMIPIALYHTRQIEKLISNYFRKIDESYAARLQNLKEVHAKVDELAKPVDEISESADEMSESFDRMDERLDRNIEFKRLISEYLDNKIKRIEARENFCESQFWDEKNIH